MIKKINEIISYIPATSHPLSADIGIVTINDKKWIYDVGNNESINHLLTNIDSIVISHFHEDHLGNIKNIKYNRLFVSKETSNYTKDGTIINQDTIIDNVHLFILPSTHAKGCLGMEVNNEYCFVGDALYGKWKDNELIYNVQKLKAQIDCLKNIKSKYLLISHDRTYCVLKDEKIKELENIYNKREKNNPYIQIEEN